MMRSPLLLSISGGFLAAQASRPPRGSSRILRPASAASGGLDRHARAVGRGGRRLRSLHLDLETRGGQPRRLLDRPRISSATSRPWRHRLLVLPAGHGADDSHEIHVGAGTDVELLAEHSRVLAAGRLLAAVQRRRHRSEPVGPDHRDRHLPGCARGKSDRVLFRHDLPPFVQNPNLASGDFGLDRIEVLAPPAIPAASAPGRAVLPIFLAALAGVAFTGAMRCSGARLVAYAGMRGSSRGERRNAKIRKWTTSIAGTTKAMPNHAAPRSPAT